MILSLEKLLKMMFLVYILLVGTFLSNLHFAAAQKDPFANETSFQSVGCYKDELPHRALPIDVANYRNDEHIDWNDINNSLVKLVKLCAKEVQNRNYVYFGVQFWGECWSGPDTHQTYDKFGNSSDCYNNIVGRGLSNYVYRLTGEENECHSHVYKVYDQNDRSVFAGAGQMCDFGPHSTMYWYRFQGKAGTAMADSCVAKNHCSTRNPGWLSTSGHETSVLQGIRKDQKVCFSEAQTSSDTTKCCSSFAEAVSVQVRNCGRFFVYKLPGTKLCFLRYCGNGLQE